MNEVYKVSSLFFFEKHACSRQYSRQKFINEHGKDFKIIINCICIYVDFHLLDKLHNYFYIISKLKQ